MAKDINYYLGLITPEHAGKPNFRATLAAIVQPFADAQAFNLGLYLYFDLDLAIGVQLDAVGQRVGISRNVLIPIPSPWFAFDDALHGFDKASWKYGLDTGNYLVALGDDAYRRLIRAKIAANYGDGSITTASATLIEFVGNPATNVIVQNNARANAIVPDVSTIIGISGALPPTEIAEIIGQKLIPLIPDGVETDVLFTSVNNMPLFGFDIENTEISGFDAGAIGVGADFLVNNPT